MTIGKALFIGAHNDDCEYSCGGLAYILSQKGFEVTFLNVACKRRIYRRYPGNEKEFEIYKDENVLKTFHEQDLKASEILGANKIIIGKQDDSFFECTNESIYMIKNQIEEIRPDIAFIIWPKDNHIDHAEVSRASFKALCYSATCEIHAYEIGPNQSMCYFYPDFYVNINSCMEKIKESCMVFDQLTANGPALYEEKENSALLRGCMSGFKYAEAYKILKFPKHGCNFILPEILKEDFTWAGSDQYPWGSRYFT